MIEIKETDIKETPKGFRINKQLKPYGRLRITVPTREEAETILTLYLKGELDMDKVKKQSTHSSPKERTQGLTWRTLYDLTIRSHWREKKSTAQQDNAERAIKEYLGWDTPVKYLDSMGALEIAEKMEDGGRSTSTISKYMSAIRQMLKSGKELQQINWELPKLPHFKQTKRRINFFEYDQEERIVTLMHQLDEAECADLFVLLIETGMRTAEGQYLKWSNVDMRDRVIRIWAADTKTDEHRRVPLSDKAHEILRRRRLSIFGDRVFPNSTKGHLRSVWSNIRLMTDNSDEDFVWYTTRHTAATRMIRNGVNVKVIQMVLGHKRIETTMRYVQFASDDLVEARVALDKGREEWLKEKDVDTRHVMLP